MRIDLFVFVALTLIAAPAGAQLTPEQARAKTEGTPVVVVVPDGTWKGRLVNLDAQAVTIQPKSGPEKTLPLSNVLRIEARKRDPVGNGAIAGGLILGVWCLLVCGQGLDSGGDLGGVVLVNALLGAGIGAAIDAGHTSKVSIYKPPPVTPARKSPSVFFTVRF